jgi:hypothetical protein
MKPAYPDGSEHPDLWRWRKKSLWNDWPPTLGCGLPPSPHGTTGPLGLMAGIPCRN